MNNEEKILSLLETMQGQMDKMQNQIDGMYGQMEEMQDTLTKVAVTQEAVIEPKLQLLYEGQVHLQETLAPKERVEVLEDEVITLKSAVKMISKRLAALEKAQ